MNQQHGTEYRGLTDEQIIRSRELHGENKYEIAKRKSLLKRFLENLNDPIIRILLIAMAVNLLFTIRNINWAETAGIVIAILLSSIVSTVSEYGSERVFLKMQQENRMQSVNVIRNGLPVTIAGEELVVGDCVLLASGERVLADGVILTGCVQVDQSAINGESTAVEKHPSQKEEPRNADSPSRLFAGSLICEGEGLMVVTEVGARSLYGKIAKEVQEEKEFSPLKRKLSKLAKTISKIGYIAAILVAATYLFDAFVIDGGFIVEETILRLTNLRYLAVHLMKAITIAMTVIVVAVPEGLPMMITVVLASNMKRMLKDKVLVKRLSGIETAGNIDLLFTDKTGTLTVGQLECSELVFGTGDRYNGKIALPHLSNLLAGALIINSSCKKSKDGTLGGNPTEKALFTFLKEPSRYVDADERILFDSRRKYSGALVRSGAYKGVYLKGAPEKILPYCQSCYDQQGRKTPFDKEKMQKLICRLSGQSARIIALATAERLASPDKAGALTFLAIAVLRDTVRKEAGRAVTELENAGIHTVMITGDSKDTATGVAVECGILKGKRQLVLDSKDLERLSDQELAEKLERIAVVARALPEDKSRLVRVAQKAGHVIGMTGDGMNDAPALKKADVGFAMGSGNEIAKEAGDIVILDNNLRSIANAVLYGRTIFKSIRKFITFQLTMNMCAVGVSLFGQIMGIESPITVIQMLWVNMIMDTLGGLAFAGEYPLRYYMKERPIGREEPILTKEMIAHTLIMGSFGTALCTAFLGNEGVRQFFGFNNDPNPLLTAFFALFIFTGLVICFTTRSERVNLLAGITKNKLFVLIMCIIVIVQLMMLYFGGVTFRCVGLSFKGLLLVNACSLSVIPVDLLRRMITKRVKTRKKDRK